MDLRGLDSECIKRLETIQKDYGLLSKTNVIRALIAEKYHTLKKKED